MNLETYEPQNLTRWTMPRDYFGETWPLYYSAGVGQTRDSDALARSNFRCMLAALGGENGDDVRIVRENHWACGWVEWIAIHQDMADALKIADDLRGKLDDYPIISEDDYSELEDQDCAETWENCYNQADRLDYLRDHAMIQGNFKLLREAVSGSWSAAANVLPCPSDLIC
jgi:hypothetical protein